MLQDSHAHLQAVSGQAGMEAVLSGLKAGGVGRIFCNSTSPGDWDAVAAIAGRHEEVIPFYGVHPWFADKALAGWEEALRGFLGRRPSGLGEIGLDRAREAVSFEIQREVFARQLDMARTLKRPFALHAVEAWGACIDSIRAGTEGKAPFIVHSFSGPVEAMEEFIKLGGYISFSLKLVEKRFEKAGAAFRAAPLERLLLETDFPYAPGAVSKMPAGAGDYFGCISKLYGMAARIRGIREEELEKAVWDNGSVFVR